MTISSFNSMPALRTLVVTAVLLATPLLAPAQGGFESPPVFMARDILAADVVAGPNHRVEERVENDGFVNHYTITSRFGTVGAVSTAELRQRIHEMNVVAALDALAGTSEFAKNVGSTAGKAVKGAGKLITHPVSTVSGAVSGVGKLFQRAGDSVFGAPASDSEDDAVKRLIGFSSVKRAYAKEFGVDPYSANPILQEHLERVAWAGYAGSIGASAALLAVPGGAGAAISVAKGSETLGEVDVSVAPTDLRRMSRQRLEAMGVSTEIIDVFLGNTVYAPTTQSRLVAALAGMQGVAGRDTFIKVALATDSRDVAFYRERQARLYSGYHRNVTALAGFDPLAGVATGRTASGKVVVVAPTDYVVWTQSLARTFARAGQQGGEREIWLAGGVSDLARSQMEQRGWKVFDLSEDKLLGGN